MRHRVGDVWRIGLAVIAAFLVSATASLVIFAAAVDCQIDCESPWVVVGGYAPLALLVAGVLSVRRRNLRPLCVGPVVLICSQQSSFTLGRHFRERAR